MNRDRVTRWTAALRSGKYRQGENQLRVGDRFCCLGVACDLEDPDEWDGNVYRDSVTFLPEDVRDEYGFSEGEESFLTLMNDSGKSFAEIADWLEQRLAEDEQF